jgi:hypothetical protein
MKRTLVLIAAWLGAAAAAVGVGFLAISLAGAAEPSAPRASLAADSTSATTPSTPSTASTTPAPPAVPSGEQVTAGGTVFASCLDGVPQLAGAPTAGWEVEQYADHVEFESATQKVEVYVDCSSGSPVFSVEGPRAEDGDRSSSSAPASTSPAGDDNGGDRGGQGSDDPPGDDNGGDRGGHGSDD